MADATKKVLDFTNVKDRGDFNPKHKAEGDYRMKIVKCESATSQENKNEMWVYTLVLPNDKTAAYPYRCVLNENNLWKLRNLFAAAGVVVPKKKVNVDPNKIVGRTIGATLVDDEYEGKLKSIVDAVFSESDLGADEPDDEGDGVSEADMEEMEVDEL